MQETGERRPRRCPPFCVWAQPHGPGAGALRGGQEGELGEAVLAAHACALSENGKDGVSPGPSTRTPPSLCRRCPRGLPSRHGAGTCVPHGRGHRASVVTALWPPTAPLPAPDRVRPRVKCPPGARGGAGSPSPPCSRTLRLPGCQAVAAEQAAASLNSPGSGHWGKPSAEMSLKGTRVPGPRRRPACPSGDTRVEGVAALRSCPGADRAPCAAADHTPAPHVCLGQRSRQPGHLRRLSKHGLSRQTFRGEAPSTAKAEGRASFWKLSPEPSAGEDPTSACGRTPARTCVCAWPSAARQAQAGHLPGTDTRVRKNFFFPHESVIRTSTAQQNPGGTRAVRGHGTPGSPPGAAGAVTYPRLPAPRPRQQVLQKRPFRARSHRRSEVRALLQGEEKH